MRATLSDPFFDGDGPLLDLDAVEAFEAPLRLTRDEGRAAAGSDWSHTRISLDEDADND